MRLPAYFTGFGSKADGSASLRFSTQELSSEHFAEFKVALNSFGWLNFAPTEALVEVPRESLSDDRKKPSQRLRAVIFLFWKQKGNEGDFEQFYRSTIEHIIDRYKEKLS